jgi:hypothetical protein
MRDYDDYLERDCECGHGEHRGPCRRSYTVYYPPGQPVPPNADPAFTHVRAAAAALKAYRIPCNCNSFREYEGPGEPDGIDPPEYDREADLESQEAP